MNRKGFTLIELLVVIAIIAILAAILFPVFARARAKAMQASCLSNVKQIALGMAMYTTDYNDRYPYGWGQWPSGNGPQGAITSLTPYIKNNQIWRCPSAAPWEANNMGYALYIFNFWYPDSAHNWELEATGRISDPAGVIELGDAVGQVWGGMCGQLCDGTLNCGLTASPAFWPSLNSAWYPSWLPNGEQMSFEARHDGLCNFAFLDGHAKAMALSVITSTYEYADGTPPPSWALSYLITKRPASG